MSGVLTTGSGAETKTEQSGLTTAQDFEPYLNFYNRLNAKNEEISKRYNNDLIIQLSDVEELHYKVIQSIDSIKPVNDNINLRISVSLTKGEAEKFNSFEEFKKRNQTSPCPTSDICLIYTFALYDDEIKEIEHYKVVCVLNSKITRLNEMLEDAPTFIPRAFITRMIMHTALIKVEYSDYVKARHFTAMFDEWINSCHESDHSRIMDKLQRVSRFIPTFGLLIVYSLLAVFTVSALGEETFDLKYTIQLLIVYASIFAISISVTNSLLKRLAYKIDSYIPLSYLNLNKGDEKQATRFNKENKESVLYSALGLVGAVVIGVGANASYDFIKFIINILN